MTISHHGALLHQPLSGQSMDLAICSSLIALSAARWAQVMVHSHDSTASAPTAFPSRVGQDLAHASP